MCHHRWCSVVFVLLLFPVSARSMAAVLRVKANAPGPARDGASWSTAYSTVAEALAASAPGDEIWVTAGDYRSAAALTLREGVSLYGGFAGSEATRDERDPGANLSTLRPTDTEITVVLAPPGITTATVLDGFTITGGHGTKRNGSVYGGGVLCDQSSPTITQNVFTANAVGASPTTAGYGGGIAVLGGSPLIKGNTFVYNNAGIYATEQYGSDRGGGADIACIGGAATVRDNTFIRLRSGSAASRLYFEDTTAAVTGNRLEGQAYGIQVQRGAEPTIQANVIQDSVFWAIRCDGDARITGNTLSNTGPMPYPDVPTGTWVSQSAPAIKGNSISGFGAIGIAATGGTPVISGNTISDTGNAASTGNPAGIQLDATAATVRDNTIENNTGAGIAIGTWREQLPDVIPTIRGNTIRNNDGPAVTAYIPIILSDNDITGNEATGPAVAIQLGSPELRSVTVSGNHITDNLTVGALRIQSAGGGVEVTDNEVARNTHPAAASVHVWGRSVAFIGNRVTDNIGPSVSVDIRAVGPLIPVSQVRDNLIVRNSGKAATGGNALRIQGRADIVGNTVADNDLGPGAALYLTDPSLVANNIVAFNRAGIRGEYEEYKRPILRHNLVFGNELGNYWNIPDPTGTDGNLSVDPLFVDRAAGHYRLLTGSPAINAGDDSATRPDERDVDGNPRVIGPHVDIGALEYPPPDAALVADAARALRIAAGLDAATVEDVTVLDTDASGVVDLLDAAVLLRRAIGQ